MPRNSSILLVGCGKMGGALLDGWLASPTPPRLVVLDRHRPASEPDYTVIRSVGEIAQDFRPDLVVLAIKPSVACDIVSELRHSLGERLAHSAILSIMAGITCDTLASVAKIGETSLPVIRAMPNTPVAIGAGTSGLYIGAGATDRQRTLCHDLLAAVGDVVPVEEESDLLTVTAISGSGPAYVFLLAELLEKAATDRGLSPSIARRLARGTVYGAGRMLDESAENAEDLRKAVTSPNGTTAAALNVLMAGQAWPDSVNRAIDAAATRAEELSR